MRKGENGDEKMIEERKKRKQVEKARKKYYKGEKKHITREKNILHIHECISFIEKREVCCYIKLLFRGPHLKGELMREKRIVIP